jgi:hypothetical protein
MSLESTTPTSPRSHPHWGDPAAKKRARRRTRVGAYSREGSFALIDKRSREFRYLQNRKKELIAHVGGSPSATQLALIERCAWLSLRVALLDERIALGTLTAQDTAQYLAWSNALSRTLVRLGLRVPTPSLNEYLAKLQKRGTS